MKDLLNQPIFKKLIFLLAIIILVSLLAYNFGIRRTSPVSPSTKEIEEMARPSAEVELSERFEFPVEEEEAIFNFNLVEAKKVKLIARQGEPMTASADEEFLVVAIELENNNSFSLEVNSQNFIRLVGEENKNYAPDFYNDQIEVPPDSIKKDEVAFIVSAKGKEFKLLVGPVNKEERSEVEIKF